MIKSKINEYLTDKSKEIANDLLKNLNPKEALAVLEMAKVLIETYINS